MVAALLLIPLFVIYLYLELNSTKRRYDKLVNSAKKRVDELGKRDLHDLESGTRPTHPLTGKRLDLHREYTKAVKKLSRFEAEAAHHDSLDEQNPTLARKLDYQRGLVADIQKDIALTERMIHEA